MIQKWTVILIPHDRGNRRTFHMSDLHLWTILGVVLGLVFCTGFFYYGVRDARDEAKQIEERLYLADRAIPETNSGTHLHVGIPHDESVRADYEQRFRLVAEELSRLYDLEKEVRVQAGLPTNSSEEMPAQAFVRPTGKGGDFSGADAITFGDDPRMQPNRLIEELTAPSTDLLVEEARLRRESILKMLADMDLQKERIAHTPSMWPSNEPGRYINSKYGRRRDPFTKEWRHHNGIDISANYGTPILATAEGTVVFSGYHQFLGNLVKIEHGYGLESWYGHMSKRLVDVGQKVARGETIGKVGSTGRSTGAHIHYEVHVDGERVDPQQFIIN